MAATLTTFRAMLDERVEDEYVTDARRDAALRSALNRYSNDRPVLRVSAETAGAGSALVVVPTGWETDFSKLIRIEYPSGESDPVYLRNGEVVAETQADGTKKLRFRTFVPTASGPKFRALFTARHTIDDLGDDGEAAAATTTIPAGDRPLFADIAAHYLCRMLASLCAKDAAPNINADTTDQAGPAQRYGASAASFLKAYLEQIGSGENSGPAVAFAEWGESLRSLIFSKVLVDGDDATNQDRYSAYERRVAG